MMARFSNFALNLLLSVNLFITVLVAGPVFADKDVDVSETGDAHGVDAAELAYEIKCVSISNTDLVIFKLHPFGEFWNIEADKSTCSGRRYLHLLLCERRLRLLL